MESKTEKVESKKIPDSYRLQFKFYDNEIGKDVEAWYNPTEKDVTKAWIRKVV